MTQGVYRRHGQHQPPGPLPTPPEHPAECMVTRPSATNYAPPLASARLLVSASSLAWVPGGDSPLAEECAPLRLQPRHNKNITPAQPLLYTCVPSTHTSLRRTRGSSAAPSPPHPACFPCLLPDLLAFQGLLVAETTPLAQTPAAGARTLLARAHQAAGSLESSLLQPCLLAVPTLLATCPRAEIPPATS